jgi:hypothetical protein
MKRLKTGMAVLLAVVAGIALLAVTSPEAQAQDTGVDPQATQILKRMTDYLGSLQKFSVQTQNTIEELLDAGPRVDIDISARVIVSRPDKLHAERKGGLLDQVFFYDGNTLTLFNPPDGVYASESAPGTIEEMLDFARESLDLVLPAADLVYRNAFPLLMQDVYLAMVVGQAVIGEVVCDHLLFSRPGVDFQVWVAAEGEPLPYKYVVTDRAFPGRLSIVTVMRDWNVAPPVSDARFTFTPPQGTKSIRFLPRATGN